MISIFRKAYMYWLRRRDQVEFARAIGATVGEHCKLVSINGGTFGSEPYLVRLGDHVEVTSGVNFITHDGGAWVFRDEHPDLDVLAPIDVGNNVFIGQNSVVLPGTVIGDNCVVGAGSVVRGKLEPDGVYAGVPVRRIKELSEYRQGLLKRNLGTKTMNTDDKHTYLKNYFKICQ